MTTASDAAALTAFIRDRLVPGELRDRFDETSPLLEWGVLDSVSTAILLGFIRRELRVTVPAAQIDPANFTDARSVAEMVRRLGRTGVPSAGEEGHGSSGPVH
jgi:peptidyl carrier protein